MKPVFVIDFDGTFTEAPHPITAFIACLMFHGHTVVFCTGRKPEDKLLPGVDIPSGIRVIYCSHRPKRQVLAEHGFTGHIVFLDDMPEICGEARMLVGVSDAEL